MDPNNFIIHAYLLDNQNHPTQITWDDISSNHLSEKSYWLHLDGNHTPVQDWLKNESKIDPHIIEIMLSKQTRARFVAGENGFLIVLKAINQRPHGSPEDMASIRIYVEKNRIITFCLKNVLNFPILDKKLSQNGLSITPFGIMIQIANELFSNLEEVIEALDEEIDKIDEYMNTANGLANNLVPSLSQVRSQTIILKSYLTPQKEVLHALMNLQIEWFEKKSKNLFSNFSEKISLYLESLEVIKERTVVMLDEIRIRNVEKTNRNSYIFSVVAVLFLPLGFLTGLFGINLAGIPGANDPLAFTIFCTIIFVISVSFIVFLKKIKWI